MKSVFFISFILLILPYASADIENPVLVESVNVVVTKTGEIKATGGMIKNLELNLSLPQRTGWQLPDYSVTTEKDIEGNIFAAIKKTNPSNPFRYAVSTSVLTKARITDSLPDAYEIPKEYMQYIESTDNIQCQDQNIESKAREITENSTTEFEKLARIAVWVHENLEYERSFTGMEKDALWVLNNKKGVCAEYTSLFVAMARSIGIPTKYVSGYSYTEKSGWMGHAWAESYIGEWVPFDPTWMEAGHLDATHIHVFSSIEHKAENFYTATYTPGAHLEWEGSGALGSPIREVQLESFVAAPPYGDYEIKSGAGNIGFGDETVIYMALKSKDYKVVDLNLVTCAGSGALDVEKPQRFEILEPGEERIFVWSVSAPSNLDKGYIYKCPLVLNSAYLAERSKTITILEDVGKVRFSAWIEKSSLELGEDQAVSFSVPSYPSGTEITVIAEDGLHTYAASSDTKRISFTPKSLGRKTAWVFSNFGGVEKLVYDVVGSQDIAIENIDISENIMEGEDIGVSFTLENRKKVPQNLRISVEYNGNTQSRQLMLKEKETISFSFSDVGAGEGIVSVSVEGNIDSINRKIAVSVSEKPSIVIQTSFQKGGNSTNVTFAVSKKGEPINILIFLNGKIMPLSGGEGTVEMLPGEYGMRAVWYDRNGREYSLNKRLNVPSSGILGFNNEVISPCTGVFIILGLFLFAFGKKS